MDALRDVYASCVVHAVSTVFVWPVAWAALLRRLPHVAAAATLAAYVFGSYKGRPERVFGRPWHALNVFYTSCHRYFPVSLDLDLATLPDQFVLTLHPHGPFPLAASILMPQLALKNDARLRRVRFAAASAVFWLPLVRDVYVALGCVEASRTTLTRCLKAGLSVAILPGGEAEQLLVCPPEFPTEDLVAPRDGLFRLALETGAPIVPAYGFGERDAYRSSAYGLAARRAWSKRYRVGVPFAWGRYWFFPFVPRRQAVRVCVGEPVPPPPPGPLDVRVATYRDNYKTAVEALFERHKRTAPGSSAGKTLRWV